MEQHRIVSRDEWLKARIALLAREKSFTRQQRSTELRSNARLPWVKVEKELYLRCSFRKGDAGRTLQWTQPALHQAFHDGTRGDHQCVGCSLEVDHVEGILEHLENHDVSYVAVARALDRGNRGGSPADGLAVSLGLVVPQRFQLRFQRVLHARAACGRQPPTYNFQHMNPGVEDLSGDSVFLSRRCRRDFPYLLRLRPWRRRLSRDLPNLRCNAEGTRRERALSFAHRLGAAEELVR